MPPLRTLRREFGWRQADLARAAGVSKRTVGAIERGQVRPYPPTMLRIATALGAAIRTVDEFRTR